MKPLHICDLFCGAGGSVTGASEAVAIHRAQLRGTRRPERAGSRRGAGNLLTPILIPVDGPGGNGEHNTAQSIDRPFPTVRASRGGGSIAQPFLVQIAHNGATNSRVKSVDEPMSTVCGNRGEWALCEPSLLPQHAGGILRSVDQPTPTVTCDGAIALIQPLIVKYYGTGVAQGVDEPLDTVTAKPRFGLAEPIVFKTPEGTFMLDILYRMVQPHELALAQGFRRDYKFVGNKTDVVKQIGNAVPRRTMRALVLAAQSQDPDVSKYLDELEAVA